MRVNFICASIGLLSSTLFAGILHGVGIDPWVGFSEEGHSIVIEVDGIEEFLGVSSVTYSHGDKTRPLGIDGYTLQEPIQESIRQTPFGESVSTKVSMGATEIYNLLIIKSTVTIDLSDAGAQDNSLTLYCKQPLKAAHSENCKVTIVKNLGNILWRVNPRERKWSKAQSIELAVKGK